MAAISFPNTPAINDVHTVGDRSWKFNGVAWKLVPRSTDAITEGSNNLFFTNARVASAPAVTALESRASAIESAATALTSRVTTAEGGLSSEISRATAAEAALGTRIDNVLSNVDGAALDSLTEVVAAFEAADSNLNNAITSLASSASSGLAAETAARETADAQLQSNIDVVSLDLTSLGSEVNTLESNLATEITNREIAVNTEQQARIASDSNLETLINNEAAARLAGDQSLASDLTALEETVEALGTMANQDASSVAITGGSIDGTPIGLNAREVGRFTHIMSGEILIEGSGNGLGIREAYIFPYSQFNGGQTNGTTVLPQNGGYLATEDYVDEADTALSDRATSLEGRATTAESDIDALEGRATALEEGKQIKNVVSISAPSHVEGLRWVDPTDMSEYLSYGGVWVELDKQ